MLVAEVLNKYSACSESIKWVGKRKVPKVAWDACLRGDWLLWIAAMVGVKREIVVFAACQCARLSLKHTEDPRVLECIEVTEAWTKGKATLVEVEAARRAAAVASDDAGYAAYAAAAAAAVASAYAAAAYAAAAGRKKTQKACAMLVRKHIPWKFIAEKLK